MAGKRSPARAFNTVSAEHTAIAAVLKTDEPELRVTLDGRAGKMFFRAWLTATSDGRKLYMAILKIVMVDKIEYTVMRRSKGVTQASSVKACVRGCAMSVRDREMKSKYVEML